MLMMYRRGALDAQQSRPPWLSQPAPRIPREQLGRRTNGGSGLIGRCKFDDYVSHMCRYLMGHMTSSNLELCW